MVTPRGRLLSYLLVSVYIVLVVNTVLLPSDVMAAFTMGIADGANSAKGVDQAATLFGASGVFQTLTNVMLFVVGAISVIMLIIGGIRYVVSGGDSTAVQGAKNTILYAIVGIIICILSYAVVSFVIGSFTGGTGSDGGISPTNI